MENENLEVGGSVTFVCDFGNNIKLGKGKRKLLFKSDEVAEIGSDGRCITWDINRKDIICNVIGTNIKVNITDLRENDFSTKENNKYKCQYLDSENGTACYSNSMEIKISTNETSISGVSTRIEVNGFVREGDEVTLTCHIFINTDRIRLGFIEESGTLNVGEFITISNVTKNEKYKITHGKQQMEFTYKRQKKTLPQHFQWIIKHVSHEYSNRKWFCDSPDWPHNNRTVKTGTFLVKKALQISIQVQPMFYQVGDKLTIECSSLDSKNRSTSIRLYEKLSNKNVVLRKTIVGHSLNFQFYLEIWMLEGEYFCEITDMATLNLSARSQIHRLAIRDSFFKSYAIYMNILWKCCVASIGLGIFILLILTFLTCSGKRYHNKYNVSELKTYPKQSKNKVGQQLSTAVVSETNINCASKGIDAKSKVMSVQPYQAGKLNEFTNKVDKDTYGSVKENSIVANIPADGAASGRVTDVVHKRSKCGKLRDVIREQLKRNSTASVHSYDLDQDKELEETYSSPYAYLEMDNNFDNSIEDTGYINVTSEDELQIRDRALPKPLTEQTFTGWQRLSGNVANIMLNSGNRARDWSDPIAEPNTAVISPMLNRNISKDFVDTAYNYW